MATLLEVRIMNRCAIQHDYMKQTHKLSKDGSRFTVHGSRPKALSDANIQPPSPQIQPINTDITSQSLCLWKTILLREAFLTKTKNPPVMSPSPKIAIIGGGPAGCTLARLLLNAQIPVTIFEGEASRDVRTQGGTLDLHTATGLKALKEAGLFDEFIKYARYDGEAFTVADKNMKRYISLGPATKETSRGRPEIDRYQLREIFLDSLPPGTIRWGSRLRRIDDDLSLHFDHGAEKGYNLIVGADGAWSKVRPLLSQAQPVYSGISGMEFQISDAKERYPDIHKIANGGSFFAYADGRSISAQQNSGGCLKVYVWGQRDENWTKTCGYDVQNGREVKKAFLHEYEGWADPMLKMIQVTDDYDLAPRSLYELPVGHRWEHYQGVTLIGDAAHLTSPFAGEGVNIAMDDALKLSQAIITAVKDPWSTLDEGINAFEQDMFRRGTAVQEKSRANMLDMLFTPGAPASTINHFVRRALLGTGWMQYLLPLWAVRLMLISMFLFSTNK